MMNEKSKIFAIKALIAPVLVAIPIFFMQAKGLMSGSESVMRTKITRQSKTLSSSEQTSENNRLLKTMLSNHPMADLEGNGILTMEEARVLASNLRKEEPRRRHFSGYPFGLKEFYEKRYYTNSENHRLRYYVMKPEDYDSTRRYPLVVCLHGGGGKAAAAQVLAEPEKRTTYPCFVFVPEANVGEDWGTHPDPIRAELFANIQPLVLEAIADLEKTFSIDTNRIYVTGHSFGGFGPLTFVFKNPTMFAAAAPISGYCEPDVAPFLTKTSIWIFHGAQDKVVTVDHSGNIVKTMKNAGGNPKHAEFPNVGHEAAANAYAIEELWEWLFAQKRNPG